LRDNFRRNNFKSSCHPIYVAKEVATLDVLSAGRAILGIGIGWMEDEFRALGIPFAERVARTEEACAALRTLWRPGAHAFKGEHFAWEALESNPKPVQPGGVPIVVEDQGVSRLVIAPPGFDREALCAGLDRLADTVLAKLS